MSQYEAIGNAGRDLPVTLKDATPVCVQINICALAIARSSTTAEHNH